MRVSLLLTVPLVAGLSACGGSSPSGSGGASTTSIKLTAGDTSCDLPVVQFDPGTVTFDVQNTGKDVTEVYVYGKGSAGSFDKVVGEVENIAPQTSRSFPVTLTGGEYEVACKPGQTGDGIRKKITVTGGGGTASRAAYDREVVVTAKDYAFTGLAAFTAKAGERIEFKLDNQGAVQHELEVLGPDGTKIGEVGPTDPGKRGEVILELKSAGTYTYLCGIGDHETRGLKGTFTVTA